MVGSFRRSVGAIDIGAWLPNDPDSSVPSRNARPRDAIDVGGGSLYPHDTRLAFARDRAFDGVQRLHQSGNVADIDPMIAAGRQCVTGQQVHIGIRAADEQDSFSRIDAGVNLRRHHIADEGIAQRDQVCTSAASRSRDRSSSGTRRDR